MKITYALVLAGLLAFSGWAFAASSTSINTSTSTAVNPVAAATVDTAKGKHDRSFCRNRCSAVR